MTTSSLFFLHVISSQPLRRKNKIEIQRALNIRLIISMIFYLISTHTPNMQFGASCVRRRMLSHNSRPISMRLKMTHLVPQINHQQRTGNAERMIRLRMKMEIQISRTTTEHHCKIALIFFFNPFRYLAMSYFLFWYGLYGFKLL